MYLLLLNAHAKFFMIKMTSWIFSHLPEWLLLTFVVTIVWHISTWDTFIEKLRPQSIYSLTLDIAFDQDDESVNIETYIPQDGDRQQIIKESILANGLAYLVSEDDKGRVAQWSGTANLGSIQYKALISTQEVNYQINNDLLIPRYYPENLTPFLLETDAVQVTHPEIKELWESIKPTQPQNINAVVQAIYDYTYRQIEGAPFKGLTDALTALRIKQASCNGKSRLFVALARLNNIPARLVGGVILNQGSKKTSHQWLELYIEGHWVPFGPTNGNFARLPGNYLTLYRTDQVLFRHSSDINFDYLFNVDKRLVSPSLYSIESSTDKFDQSTDPQKQTIDINITQLLLRMGLAPQTVGLFLLFPLCTLLITFLRNIIGIKTFGIFMPMLIAAACVFTGFTKGIIGFSIILLVSFLTHIALAKMRILKIPRLAAIITINTVFFIVGLGIIGTGSRMEFGMLSLFPVVIISFVAEKIQDLTSENNWSQLCLLSLGTLTSISLCYWILGSFLLEGLVSFYPEFYLLILATQLYIGKWTGLRLTELHRFKRILGDKKNPVLGINGRNRELVYQHNEKKLLRIAADKLCSKQILQNHKIPVPQTFLVIENFTALNCLNDFLDKHTQFALKPNQGSRGHGIIIVVDKKDGFFLSAGGKKLSYAMIKQHCAEILNGSFSQLEDNDTAYFEPLISQHHSLQKLAPYGLSDIRVIVNKGRVISAMLRMPTLKSDGKANLHQGAVGVAIDIQTGLTQSANFKQKSVIIHPDNSSHLINIQLPFWEPILNISKACYDAIGLGYLGVDICLDETLGPLVLEVNGRPGIEIQNVQNKGFYREFQY